MVSLITLKTQGRLPKCEFCEEEAIGCCYDWGPGTNCIIRVRWYCLEHEGYVRLSSRGPSSEEKELFQEFMRKAIRYQQDCSC